MKIAVHQPNFIPNFPFFYKMAMAEKFVILCSVQFEKNGYQNRYLLNTKEKWVTRSVKHGNVPLFEKEYTDGKSLLNLNMKWIYAIRETLGINTEICFPMWHGNECSSTERLALEIKMHGGDTYITNPDAKNKYLDEELMKERGIDIEYCKVPKHLQKHTFEIFEEYGIDGAMKQLPKRKNEILNTR